VIAPRSSPLSHPMYAVTCKTRNALLRIEHFSLAERKMFDTKDI
jgi:hypothetical protein